MEVASPVRTADGSAGRKPRGDSARLPPTPGRKRQDPVYVDAVSRDSDEIDRAAWAKLLNELLISAGLTPETAAAPNGPIDANWRTIRKWLTKDQGISVRRIRDVARALGYPPTHALVQVGFLTQEETGLAGPTRPGPVPDPLLRRLAGALANQTIPDDDRGRLRRALQHSYDIWLEWIKTAAQEPTRRTGSASRPE